MRKEIRESEDSGNWTRRLKEMWSKAAEAGSFVEREVRIGMRNVKEINNSSITSFVRKEGVGHRKGEEMKADIGFRRRSHRLEESSGAAISDVG